MKFVVKNKVFLIFLLVMLALPVLPRPVGVPEYWITLLNYIGLYSIVAIGLVLLTGIGGMTSFGQAAFVGMGGALVDEKRIAAGDRGAIMAAAQAILA